MSRARSPLPSSQPAGGAPDASLGLAPAFAEALESLRPAFERARSAGLPVTLLGIELAGLAVARRLKGEEAARAALEALLAWLEARLAERGVARALGEKGALACVAGLSREEGEALAQELVRAARRLPLASGILLPLAPAVGLAWTGSEPRPLELLALVAADGVEAASAGSGLAHSELYEFHERRLARSAPELLERERRRAKVDPATARSTAAAPAKPQAPQGLREVVLSGAVGREVEERLARAVAEERALDPGASPEEIEARVLARADSWLSETLSKALAAQADEHRGEVDVLERRLAKLDHALKETENALRRLASAKSVDPGLASIYRDVQGLKEAEEAYSLKLGLMQQILEANLALHARISMR